MEFFDQIWQGLSVGSPSNVLLALHRVSLMLLSASLLTVVWELYSVLRCARNSYEGRQRTQRKNY